MLGLAEYARAFNDPVARQEALIFYLIDDRAHDEVNGGYHQTYSLDWKKPINDDESSVFPEGSIKTLILTSLGHSQRFIR